MDISLRPTTPGATYTVTLDMPNAEDGQEILVVHCDGAGSSEELKGVANTDSSASPATGDDSRVPLWVLLAVIGMVGIISLRTRKSANLSKF